MDFRADILVASSHRLMLRRPDSAYGLYVQTTFLTIHGAAQSHPSTGTHLGRSGSSTYIVAALGIRWRPNEKEALLAFDINFGVSLSGLHPTASVIRKKGGEYATAGFQSPQDRANRADVSNAPACAALDVDMSVSVVQEEKVLEEERA